MIRPSSTTPWRPNWLQGGLKCPAADAVGTENFAAPMHHRHLVGRQTGKRLAVAQGVDDFTAHAGLARGRGVRVPDVLAVQLPRGDQHGELLDLLGQRGFIAQVVVEASGQLVRLRHVDHDGTRPVAGDRPKSLHHLVEDGPLGFGNTLSGGDR